MAQDMSFAQALNEAKGLIVQQATLIKGDAEKIKALQQTVVDQSATNSEQDRRLREQSDTLVRRTQEVADSEKFNTLRAMDFFREFTDASHPTPR